VQVDARFLNGRRHGPQFADKATASSDQLIVKARHGAPVTRAARDYGAQRLARHYKSTKLRRAWDVESRNAADSATLAARASETTRVVTGAGVLQPEHMVAVTDALMYEHRFNTLVTCSCCDCRISVAWTWTDAFSDATSLRRPRCCAASSCPRRPRSSWAPWYARISLAATTCAFAGIARLSSTRSECPSLRCSTATFTRPSSQATRTSTARGGGQRLAAAGVVADHGLLGLRRPGSRATSTFFKLTGLVCSLTSRPPYPWGRLTARLQRALAVQKLISLTLPCARMLSFLVCQCCGATMLWGCMQYMRTRVHELRRRNAQRHVVQSMLAA